MRIELTEVIWLDEQVLSFSELAELSGLSLPLLEELISAGGITPIDADRPEPRYGAGALAAARHARRLCDDFELDTSALLLVLGLFDRVTELETQLRDLRAKLPRRIR